MTPFVGQSYIFDKMDHGTPLHYNSRNLYRCYQILFNLKSIFAKCGEVGNYPKNFPLPIFMNASTQGLESVSTVALSCDCIIFGLK